MHTPLSRRIFYWTLVCSYLIITSTVLFFAFGYRFSAERGIFVYSGSLTVKANPRQVQIAIDDDATKGRRNFINNSYHITGFRPGEHIVRVFADGFRHWSKKVQFTSGRSTEFWNVLLVRDGYFRTQIDAPLTERFFLSPSHNRIATVSESDTVTHTLRVTITDRDDTTQKRDILISADHFSSTETDNIEWSPRSDQLIIPVERAGDKTILARAKETANTTLTALDPRRDYVIASLNDDTEKDATRYLSEIVTFDQPRDVRWDPRNRNTLYFIADATLYQQPLSDLTNDSRISDAGAQTPATIIADDIAAYDFADDGLYMVTRDGSLQRASLDVPDAQKELSDLRVTRPDAITELIAYDRKRMTLLMDDGTFALYDDADAASVIRTIGTDIIGSHFSNDGKKLLYWSANEIFVYFIKEWDTQPLRSPGDTFSLTRLSQPIRNVQWVKTFEHVLFSTEDAIKVIELDHRSSRNQDTVVQLNDPRTHVVSDFGSDTVLFTDLVDGKRTVFSITFPEIIGLFQ